MSNPISKFPGRASGTRFTWPGAWLFPILVCALLLAPAGSARAEPDYDAARKAGRGAAGMFLGVIEVPGNIVKETRENGPIRGVTLGLVIGVGMTIVRTCVGTYELFTAPFALPAGFKPLIEPEFPWDYFVEDRSGGSGSDGDIYETY
jgi:putative exosortase-associated protein (TIGR04073 family)